MSSHRQQVIVRFLGKDDFGNNGQDYNTGYILNLFVC